MYTYPLSTLAAINFQEQQNKKKKEEMGSEEELNKSRVLQVDSQESWELFLNQANSQACPIVVHFTASWCVPSTSMNTFYENLALNYQGIFFLLVDVDEVKPVASKMEIKAMPTFLFLKDGVQIDKLVGANPEELKARVESFAQSVRPSV